MLADEPIRTPDQDRLKRSEFAEHFAKALLEHSDESCFIAALDGPWGSGKSSLLNMIAHHLHAASERDNTMVVIRFNPWNVSGLDQLIALFFHELKVAILRRDKTGRERASASAGALLDALGGILTVGELSPVGGEYFGMGAKVAKGASGRIRKMSAKSLTEIKKQLDDLLAKSAKRIFILIDDLDRLDQPSVTLMFRLIRLNADFRNVTYVLAFDRDLVGKMLSPEQAGRGQEYLEKIVQLQVSVPKPDESIITQMLTTELDAFLKTVPDNEFDMSLWEQLVGAGRFFKMFRSVRDVVRYVNGIRTTYPIIYREVNAVDFFGLEAIRIFAPKAYDGMRRNRELFTRPGLQRPLERDEDAKKTRAILDEIFSEADTQAASSDARPEVVRDMAKVLFPQLARIYSNTSYSPDLQDKWRKQKRICSIEVFDRYFMLGVPSTEISDEEMLSVTARAGNKETLKDALAGIFKRGLGTRFLEKMEDYVERVKTREEAQGFISTLFDIEDKIASQPRAMLRLGADTLVARIVYLLLKQLDKIEDRKRVLLDATTETVNLYMPTYCVSMITPQKAPDDKVRDGGAEISRELGFSDRDVEELRQACLTSIRKSAGSGQLPKAPHLGLVLFAWAQWGDEAEAREYANSLLDSEEGTLDLLVGFSTQVLSTGEPHRYVAVNRGALEKFVQIAKVESRVKEMQASASFKSTDRQMEALKAFVGGQDPFTHQPSDKKPGGK